MVRQFRPQISKALSCAILSVVLLAPAISMSAEPAGFAYSEPLLRDALAQVARPTEFRLLPSLDSSRTDAAAHSDEADTHAPPNVVGHGSYSASSPLASQTPCGIRAVLWSFAHPAQAWHIFTPFPADSDAVACLDAASSDVESRFAATRLIQ
jgi:hypothetical protein